MVPLAGQGENFHRLSSRGIWRINRDVEAALRYAYRLMRRHYGHQNWWPGETPFEVCVGAILTQNTNWANVERAIDQLHRERRLTPRRMYALEEGELAQLIRPAGYFNVKARRLRAFVAVLVEEFGADLKCFFSGSTEAVRRRLLEIPGIGPETADSMLLYAAEHLSFVIDAYTRRIFARHGWCEEGAGYEELQQLCESSLNHMSGVRRLDYWRDYHAQLVNVGKDFCRTRNPGCSECPLQSLLPE